MQGNLSRTESPRWIRRWLLLLRLLLQRVLPMRRRGLVVLVMEVVVVPLLQLLPLLLVKGELVAGDLFEDGAAVGLLLSGCYYCGCFCRESC